MGAFCTPTARAFPSRLKVAGRPEPLTHCLRLSISQAIFDHHQFGIVVPHEALEGPESDGFLGQAHRELCGKNVTISFEPIDAKQKKPAFRFTGIITRLRLGSSNDLANVYTSAATAPRFCSKTAPRVAPSSRSRCRPFSPRCWATTPATR